MREFLYKFLTEDTSVGSGLSSTNDAYNLLACQVYISTGKEKNRRINNLFEVGRIIIIKKSVVANMVILDILPFLLGSLAMDRVKKMLKDYIPDTSYTGYLMLFLMIDGSRTPTMSNELFSGNIPYIGRMLQGQKGYDIFFFHCLFHIVFPCIISWCDSLKFSLERITYLKSVDKGM